jgi:cytochrome c
MKNSGIVWNEETLDRFLADPRGVVPGTKMTYAGIKNPQDRADLIAYLKEATKE